jgi:hypothetical protein
MDKPPVAEGEAGLLDGHESSVHVGSPGAEIDQTLGHIE